jgi:hypothetical protein
VKPAPLRPEDATSYEDAAERVGRERSVYARQRGSLLSSLLWVVLVTCGPLAWVLLLVIRESSPVFSWEWASEFILSGAFICAASVLAWRGIRMHRRGVRLDALMQEWRVRTNIPPLEPKQVPSPTDSRRVGVICGVAMVVGWGTPGVFGAPPSIAVTLTALPMICMMVVYVLFPIRAARQRKELDRMIAEHRKRL